MCSLVNRSTVAVIAWYEKFPPTWWNWLIPVNEQIDNFIREIIERGHAEGIVTCRAQIGHVLRPYWILCVLDFQNSWLRLMLLLLTLLLMLNAIVMLAATRWSDAKARRLIRWKSSIVIVIIYLPISLLGLDLLLKSLVHLVHLVLLIRRVFMSTYITYF